MTTSSLMQEFQSTFSSVESHSKRTWTSSKKPACDCLTMASSSMQEFWSTFSSVERHSERTWTSSKKLACGCPPSTIESN